MAEQVEQVDQDGHAGQVVQAEQENRKAEEVAQGEDVAQEVSARRDRSRREALWRGRIEEQARSGLSVRAYCQRESVAEPSFYQWRRKFAGPRAGGGLKARPAGDSAQETSPSCGAAAFVRMDIVSGGRDGARRGGGMIEIESRGGYLIRLSAGFDRSALLEALGAIEALGR